MAFRYANADGFSIGLDVPKAVAGERPIEGVVLKRRHVDSIVLLKHVASVGSTVSAMVKIAGTRD